VRAADTTEAPPADTPVTSGRRPPPSPSPAPSEPQLFASIDLADVVDFDDAKPARDHDEFVAVALADIDRWLTEVYPEVYGAPWEPLAGGVVAGYPERQSDLPGCGEPTTSYPDLNSFAAFYCSLGDFVVYDDGDDSLLTALADGFGVSVMGVVMSHEYGHAIQQRIGALDEFIPTIFTEQQADCFSGAWVGQAYRGESPLLRLGDVDVRAGLIAMLEVRDPVGTNQLVDGGHGSAFDRVGAFQEGFLLGPARCAELLDEPLPLMPNEFQPLSLDEALGGNAPYDCDELRDLGATDAEIAECSPAPVFLADDLNDFWATSLDAGFPALSPQPVADLTLVTCDDAVPIADEALLCPAEGVVAYDEPDVLSLYREFGDFTLGYFYGVAWAEVAPARRGQCARRRTAGAPQRLLHRCVDG
jgi:predicted metalloprotease